MSRLSSFVYRFSSIKVTCGLLVAFLLLTFWGVLGQAAAGNEGAAAATERFFGSYFIWTMGVVPLPALKSLAVVGALHLIASMMYRMPSGWRNLGLYGMHIALLVLLVGSLVGSEFRQEFNGFRAVPAVGELADVKTPQKITYYTVNDSLNTSAVEVGEGYPYFTFYKGQVDMMGVKVDLYTATYDPFHFVPYVFMILFLLSAAFHYAVKVRAGSAANKKNFISVIALVFAGLFFTPSANATTLFPPAIPDSIAEKLPWNPEDPVMVNGVVRPFDSFARGIVNDLYGKVTFKYCVEDDCDDEDAVYMVGLIYVRASEEKELFKVLRSDVLQALHLPENKRYVSYNDLNASRSQLEIYASRNDDHPATLEMKRLLANVQLFEAIQRGDFRKADATPEQKKTFKAEVFYNHANFALIAFILAFIGCVLAAVNSLFKKRALDIAANSASAAVAATLTVAFALRFYIASRPPLSSLYEIVLLVAFLLEAFEFGAFLFCKKRTFSLIIPVTAMASVLLFFAKFVLEPGDLFQPIPAVLNSSVFLTIHVFTIALGYVGMILSGVVAHLHLFRLDRISSLEHQTSNLVPRASNLSSLLYATLVFGGVFTTIGTLLGGVWADFAWGRFWGFDPKECGALFVVLWSMLGLHLRGGRLISPRGFALFNCFNVIVTFLCWFGINLLGVGLHSYGFQNGTVLWLAAFIAVDSLVIAFLNSRKIKA